ncbi:unnamed protein product [Cochlearia groenlandica]
MTINSENQRNLEAGLLMNKNRNDINECRITLVLLFSTFVSVCGSFCFGCAAGYSSVAQAGIITELNLSVAQYSMFGSIMTFGGMIGAIFSGKVADLMGRKGTMWFAQIFCIGGWLAIAFAKDTIWLNAGRLSTGFAVGLFSYVIPVYIAEITPKHVRGAFVFANQLMQSCGLSLYYAIGNFVHWRKLALIGLIPCVLQVVCLFFIPESPRLLGKRGREKECIASLQLLRGEDADVSEEADTIKETMVLFDQGPKSRVMDLFQRRYAPSLIIGVGLMLLQQLSGSSGIMFYVGSVFDKGGFSSSIGSMILAVIMVPKSILGLTLVEKMGRRPLLLASTSGMTFFSLLLAFSFCFVSYGMLHELTPIFTCIGVVGFISSFAVGMGGLPWIIMSEIFPMNVKVSAGTLVTITNWLFGWVITYTFNFMLQWNASGMFFIFSMVSASTVVFIYFLVPETKGRSLEEIQALLSTYVQ